MNLPRARGRASVGTGAGALAREGFGVIVGATGASVVVGLAGGAIDTPGPYAETRRLSAGVTLANHSIVRRSPSPRGTVGVHSRPAWAFRMSGRRRAGSS